MSDPLSVSATPRGKKQKRGGKLLRRRAHASESELGEVGRSAGRCGGCWGQGCTCMRSVLAIRGIYLSKALTKEPVHGGLPAWLVVAVPGFTVPTSAVLQAELVHLVQGVPARAKTGM